MSGEDPVFAEAGCRPTARLAASRHACVHGVTRDGRSAVLKCATPETMADPVGRARFAREGRVGLGLRHPGLVATLAAGPAWILLNDLRGGSGRPCASLADRVPAGGGPADILAGLATVAEGLAHMHARGLVHLDVKPGNVLSAPDGRFVLIDLGAVGVPGDVLGAGETIGSPAWMAPEQIAGAAPAPSADSWSFAAVLGFVLGGAAPYAGTADEVLRRRRAGEGPGSDFQRGWRARAPAALAPLVAAGMADAAGRRPALGAYATVLAGFAEGAAAERNDRAG
ncbi:protein kinase [Methylobacterium sp. E-016]|uniref:protein kinase domain-containing protein n=1 Tax=Methylobacterium sp. E-016 TaxID=2836556 RepID=UPI001FBB45A7|nr:protein kinase [Methylobacterium sp. E-016]MCJ2077089.1 protein kinase [Methylobacterium sp. E-016]